MKNISKNDRCTKTWWTYADKLESFVDEVTDGNAQAFGKVKYFSNFKNDIQHWAQNFAFGGINKVSEWIKTLVEEQMVDEQYAAAFFDHVKKLINDESYMGLCNFLLDQYRKTGIDLIQKIGNMIVGRIYIKQPGRQIPFDMTDGLFYGYISSGDHICAVIINGNQVEMGSITGQKFCLGRC